MDKCDNKFQAKALIINNYNLMIPEWINTAMIPIGNKNRNWNTYKLFILIKPSYHL